MMRHRPQEWRLHFKKWNAVYIYISWKSTQWKMEGMVGHNTSIKLFAVEEAHTVLYLGESTSEKEEDSP